MMEFMIITRPPTHISVGAIYPKRYRQMFLYLVVVEVQFFLVMLKYTVGKLQSDDKPLFFKLWNIFWIYVVVQGAGRTYLQMDINFARGNAT